MNEDSSELQKDYFLSLILHLKSKIRFIYKNDEAHIKQWPCFPFKCFPQIFGSENEKRICEKDNVEYGISFNAKSFFCYIEQKAYL